MASKKDKVKTIGELLEEALVPEDEQPYEIPENWVWTNINNIICTMENRKPKDINGSIFHYIDVDAIDNKNQKLAQFKELEISNAPSRAQRKVRKNDVLISLVRPYLKNIALIDFEDAKLVASTAFYVCNTKNKVDPKYLYYYLMSPIATKYLNEHTKGDNSPSVRSSDFEKLPIPLPNKSKQIEIVDLLCKTFSKIEKAQQLIEEAKETFELRKAAILYNAFSGNLTKEFRKNQKKKTYIELESNKVKKFKSQLDPKIKENLYVLPEGWKWIELNDLIENMTYGSSSKTNDDVSGTPIIRMGNIQEGEITKVDYKYLPNDHPDVLKFDVQTNDILFNRTNSYELVGKSAIITEEFDGKYSFASYLIRLRLVEKDVLAPYIVQFINSHIGREMLLSMVTQQVGQANINSQKLASIMIPVPTIEEIKEINKQIKELKDRERNTIKILELDSSVNNLKQSILSKAFKGELGTNDPNDEPAIELLKSIIKEKL
ncbi:type I restriction enzyme, S subunit [Bacillus sp. bc15]|uniref:restriction endonuclease subunit S n=1 Tax=Bacillus sp. bc15 TaxID=1761758 RepID=UPI0009228AED|nr:restriction endonuclease subunit S [Bacillus sp. bc15]SHL25011.1 type I restriction enzyme, S subunit [Bacillus sp. bc15]